MQVFISAGRRDQFISRLLVAVSSALILSACGVDGLDTTNIEEIPDAAAAVPSTQTGEDVEKNSITEPQVSTEGDIAAVDEIPTEEEFVNLAPLIQNTSYNCDPVIEAATFNVGDTDNFTLAVNDEFPLSLTYAADISDESIVNVTVDSNGIFTLSALQAGETYLWLTAEDGNGLVDEFELWVIVD